MNSWQQLSTEVIHDDRWSKINKDKVLMPDGKEGTFTYAVRKDGLVIVPVENDHVLMVSQFRYPIRKRLIQFPMEGLEKDEIPNEASVNRCTAEELGRKAINIQKIGAAWVDPGYVAQFMHFYICTVGEETQQHLDGSEADLQVEKIKISDLGRLVKNGAICDYPTLCALYFFQNFKND